MYIKKSHIFVIIFLLATLTLLPFFILLMMNFPYIDDYFQYFSSESHGLVGAQWYIYNIWTGKYTSTLLMTLLPTLLGLELYVKVVPIGIIIFGLLSLINLYNSILEKRLPYLVSTLFAFITYLTYLFALPHIPETVFWTAGAVNYVIPGIFVIWIIFSMYKYKQTNKLKWWIVSGILVLFFGGTQEVFMMLGLFIFSLLLIWCWKYRNKYLKFILTLWFTSIISMELVIMAPGNWKRVGEFSNYGDFNLSYYITQALSITLREVSTWTFNIHFIFLALFILFLSKQHKVEVPFKVKYRHVISLFLLSITTVFLSNIMIVYLVKLPDNYTRTESVPYTFYLLLWIPIIFALSKTKNIYRLIPVLNTNMSIFAITSMSIIFLLVSLLTGNLNSVINEMGNYEYITHIAQAHRQFDACRSQGVSTCYIHKYKGIDVTVYPMLVEEYDINSYQNLLIARYYSINKIIVLND